MWMASMGEVPVFRASKKRKLERQKHAEDEVQSVEHQVEYEAGKDLDDNSDDQVNISNLIRSRRQKPRHGVQFSNTSHVREAQLAGSSTAVVKAIPEEDPLKDMSTRFTTSTGQVVDINQHMMAYIDSQMAQRKQDATIASHLQSKQNRAVSLSSEQGDDDGDNEDNHEYLSEASHGDEDDLEHPDDNVDGKPQHTSKMNSMPSSSMSGSTIPAHNQPYHLAEVSLANLPSTATTKPQARIPRPRKPRLGRDGKPLRSRPRKRANSADQARDRLVEQILAENKLESTYTGTASPADHKANAKDGTTNGGDAGSTTDTTTTRGHEDADERMAAEFRREFFEGIAERRARHHQHPSSGNAGKKSASGNVPEGPKLGGSRSARAKMHAALMAEKEKK